MGELDLGCFVWFNGPRGIRGWVLFIVPRSGCYFLNPPVRLWCVTIVAYEPRLFTSEVATDLRVLSALLVQRSLLASTDEWDGR